MAGEGYLLLYLDSPFQSWGYSSKFDRRSTYGFPTKSGIIGLISAAMGTPKNNREKLEKLCRLKMNAYVLKSGILSVDYHTVGAGYDSDPDKKLKMVPKANQNTPDPVQTWKEYLADAKYGVILYGEFELLSQCAQKLNDPIWGIWLGRKCCIPASPVFQGLFDSETESLAKLKELSGKEPSAMRKLV
ncbi:MAG: type I-E CRISPR-associated protein Cas5/CasD, partial [Candidatus Wallbacteria bacterium]|nr:type I-E CRISPR-associated protein Cas5/CasD [Candidatus Wallbacteria bacterium]